ncbi:MAG: PAS domain S-box protein [Candidatus Geothermincolia bacterium]
MSAHHASRSESKFRSIFDAANDAIWVHDLETGRILDVNRKMCEMYKCTREEALSRKVEDFSSGQAPYTQQEALGLIKKAAEEGPQLFEWLAKDGTGGLFWVEVNLKLTNIEGEERVLAIVRDITERKREQERAAEERSTLEGIIESTDNPIFSVDGNYRYTSFNRAHATMMMALYGEKIEPGKSLLEYVRVEEDRAGVKHNLDLALSGSQVVEESFYGETERSRKNFEVLWNPIKNVDGRFTGVAVFAKDITRRKWVEGLIAKLSSVKERLLDTRSLSEKLRFITGEIVEIFGADFARVWVAGPGDLCDRGCRHAAVTEGPHVCRDRSRCLHLVASAGRYTSVDGGHRRVPFGCYKIGLVASGEEAKFVTNDVVHDPRVHDHDWAEATGLVSFAGYRLLSGEGNPIGVMALFKQQAIDSDEELLLEDLANSTSQVIQTGTAEAALRRSESQLRNMFDTAQDGVIVIDATGRFVDVNRSFANMVGYSTDELAGLTFLDITPQEYALHDEKAAKQILEGGYFNEYEKEFVRKDGGRTNVVLSGGIIGDRTEGPPWRVFAFVKDITRRKRAEEELQRINAELEGFAHAVSHDLRGPLSLIECASMMLQPLIERPWSGETQAEVEESVGILVRSVEKAQNLIDELLNLAEAGQVPRDVCVVDVEKIVASVLEERAVPITHKGITVRLTPDLGSVTASPTHIYQLFANLIGNAIKHNDSESPMFEVLYLGRGKEGFHRYLVRDNGSGIPPKDLDNIFIPFFKGTSGETGIGLSTVAKIVKVYGGAIKAYNDNGACFEFSLKDLS